jgi:hypothetical protein
LAKRRISQFRGWSSYDSADKKQTLENLQQEISVATINSMAAIKEARWAQFGVNIPVSEEFLPTATRLIRFVIKQR